MHKVPAYSQLLDVPDKEWQLRACGIVSLKMAMDSLSPELSPPITELIRNGLVLDAFIPGVGWKHAGLKNIAEQLGFAAETYDWFKEEPSAAWGMLLPLLEKAPVIASIHKDLIPGTSGHLVVLTGRDETSVFYNDPLAADRAGIPRSASHGQFLAGWKRRAIALSKAAGSSQ